VTLEEGRTQRVDLHLAQPQEPVARVPLGGTLYLPPEWGSLHLSLDFEPLDLVGRSSADDVSVALSQMTKVPESSGLYRWNAGHVAAGRYEVTMYAFEYQVIVDTGPGGRSDVEIAIAPPADATLHLRDIQNGLPAEGVHLLWNCKRPSASSGGSMERTRWDADTKTYRFRAPAGEVELSIFESDWELESPELVTLQPGPNVLTLDVRRMAGIHLSLKEGDRIVPFPMEWFWSAEVKCLRGDGDGRAGSASEDEGTISVTVAGLYVIAVPELPGFEPIPPFQVEVPDREFIEYTVQVVRKQ
jgi:hypothetical protein